jgi:translation elongation factor EF-Tu-like GTPase
MLVEIFHVGVAGEEPEQLVDDRSQVQLLGGGEREAVREVEAHLMTEHRQRAGAGAIVLLRAVGENPFQQVMVLAHGCDLQAAKGRLGTRSLPPSRHPGNVQQDL